MIKARQLDSSHNRANELEEIERKLKTIDNTIKHLQNMDGQNTEKKEFVRYLVGAEIIFTTLCSSFAILDYINQVDVCIVDEATQCTEPFTLVPLQFGITSLILVGDASQLPPVVKSRVSHRLFCYYCVQ